MLAYFNRARSISHQLAQIGREVSDEDLIIHILHGLLSEFNAFNTSVCTQQLKSDNLITSSELLGLLLSEEARVNSESKLDLTSASANVSHQHKPSPPPSQFDYHHTGSAAYSLDNPPQNDHAHPAGAPSYGNSSWSNYSPASGYGRSNYSGSRGNRNGGRFRCNFRGGRTSARFGFQGNYNNFFPPPRYKNYI